LEKLRKHGIGGKLLETIGDWLRNRFVLKGNSLLERNSGAVFLRALVLGHDYS